MMLLLLAVIACGQRKKEKQNNSKQLLPESYDLTKAQIFPLPPVLNEISGIAFRNGNADTVYAQQDEEGKLFRFHLGDKAVAGTKFGQKGDYEDVQVCNNQVIMLRSDGVLYSFPAGAVPNTETRAVKEYKKLLPAGEYEGMYADNRTHKLYVLCKHCNEKLSKTITGFILAVENDDVKYAERFTIDIKAIEELVSRKNMKFQPSALAWNGQKGQWFILSSINKLLVVADANWNVDAAYPLNPSVFNQPEGIAFDNSNNMYISNEKGTANSATILKIEYDKNELQAPDKNPTPLLYNGWCFARYISQ